MLRMFYFSGTGNARNVARWMAEAWRAHGQTVEELDLTKVEASALRIDPNDEIGLASATHGFNFPPVTLAFLFAFPRAPRRNRVFIINTRAGVRLFGIHVPGLSGAAQLLAAIVFLLKGYRVVGMRPIDLPSNWISLHPGLREDNIRAIHQRCEAITRVSAQRMLSGQRDLRALLDLPIDLLIAPIALGYYCVGRFLFAKSFFASAACDACGACIKQCPVQALMIVDGRPFWSYRCESCMRCMNQCPRRAIETAHGFIFGVLVLFDIIMLALVSPLLRHFSPRLLEPGPLASAIGFVLKTGLMLVVLMLAYRVFHRALRTRVVERVAVLTSLTHMRCWRRYKSPKATANESGK
jgi:ferredoxin